MVLRLNNSFYDYFSYNVNCNVTGEFANMINVTNCVHEEVSYDGRYFCLSLDKAVCSEVKVPL
jgi:hypothetical protein